MTPNPDSGAVDSALVALLQGDATLMALMPDGVFFDMAGPSMSTPGAASTRFVLLSLVNSLDRATFGGRAFEDLLYSITAVALQGGDVKGAAARIDALLEDHQLVVAGFTPMSTYREGRIRAMEVDDHDPSIRWYHRGGRYVVQMSLNNASKGQTS